MVARGGSWICPEFYAFMQTSDTLVRRSGFELFAACRNNATSPVLRPAPSRAGIFLSELHVAPLCSRSRMGHCHGRVAGPGGRQLAERAGAPPAAHDGTRMAAAVPGVPARRLRPRAGGIRLHVVAPGLALPVLRRPGAQL